MFSGLKSANKGTIKNDIISGVIIALVSIPISMGYAQIAGLPTAWGLYCSVLPVILFALFSSSPRYIFGVDAAPAAMVGGVLASLGIASQSAQAVKTVPVITFYTAVWLFIFYFLKAGKLTQYVSTPVMGGFVSGICTTIILMQIPKLFGGTPGTGEAHQLFIHIYQQVQKSFNLPSLLLGIISIALILLAKKFIPKFPMPVAVMLISAFLQYFTNFAGKVGVATLPAVEKGLGNFILPDFSIISPIKGMSVSLTIAIVIMAETLLAEHSFAMKGNYKVSDSQEVLTFGVCNIASAFIGGCPVNGSVSRTAMNEQFGGKSQITSLTAAAVMIVILLFCTDFIQYLPVPVLTAIVICALLGAIEFDLVRKLKKINKKEMWIFIAAFFGVLVFGTIYGVIIGVVLSFVNVVIRESDPPRTFLGVIPGRDGFFNMKSNPTAKPIKDVVIYRFRAGLFFANVTEFREDIENSIKPDTKCVIVDAGGISSIDTTGADTLEALYKSLKERGIRFYLTEHMTQVNTQLRKLGLGYIIQEGAVRRTITSALRSQGLTKPYELELADGETITYIPNFKEQLMYEFEWAFGTDAQEQIEAYTQQIIDHANRKSIEQGDLFSETTLWDALGSFDEDILLESLEMHLEELSKSTGIDVDKLGALLEQRRERIYQYIKNADENTFNKLRRHRQETVQRLKKHSPELLRHLQEYHEKAVSEEKEKEKDEIKK